MSGLYESALPLVANVGVLAILAWFASYLRSPLLSRCEQGSLCARGLLGGAFGLAVVLVMAFPVQISDGVFGDSRGAPLLISGLVGGPVAAAVTAVIAAAGRYAAGGVGTFSGIVYIALVGALGVVFRWGLRRRGTTFPSLLQLTALAVVTSVVTSPVILLLPEASLQQALLYIWPQLSAANVLGTLVLGFLIETDSRWRRRIAEEGRRHAELVDNTVVGIVTIDQFGSIKMVNPAARGMFGYSEDELLGQNISMLMAEPDRSRHDGYLAAYDGPEGSNIVGAGREVEALCKDGSILPIHLSVSVCEVDGERLFSGVMIDVSKERQAYRELAEAKKLAEEASMAKSQFLSSMSHELRTPLNSILGFSELIATDPKVPLTAFQGEAVRHIRKGGTHLLGLIDQVLDLAKIESGDLALSIEAFDPDPILDDCRALAENMATKRDVRFIDGTVGGHLPAIRSDRMRLKQVLLNFLSNAIKYNRKGGTVTLRYEVIPDKYLRFLIADTGKGIPATYLDNLFKPFHRLGAEGGETEGTGIGLTITKDLVNAMGGNLGFETEEGVGSTFWFELPLAAEAQNQNRDGPSYPVSKDALFDAGRPPAARHRVLYVEDNPANLDLMMSIIGRLPGVDMISAHNAEFGLYLAETESPDLIMMDINLPGMDGIEALGNIRDNPVTADIPVVAISAAAMAGDIDRGLRAGFREYLTKPIHVEEVLRVVRETVIEEPKLPP